MNRRDRKRLSYLRAVFPPNHTGGHLQALLLLALQRCPNLAAREVPDATNGRMVLRTYRSSTGRGSGLLFEIGAGMPGERMSTLGINVFSAGDTDTLVQPPNSRAFKHAQAFGLIVNDQILMCVDHMRVSAVGRYLVAFINKAQTASAVALELRPAADVDRQSLLSEEGVRELRIKSTMMAATADAQLHDGASKLYHEMLELWRAIFVRDVADDARQQLAERWADLNVETVVKVRGGARGNEIALAAINEVGIDMLDDPTDLNVELTTERGNKISVGQLVLAKFVNVDRIDGRNDLDPHAIWDALERYEAELRESGRWQA